MILSYSGFNAYTVYKSVDQTIYQRNEGYINNQQENQLENITTVAPEDNKKTVEPKNKVEETNNEKTAMESMEFKEFTEECKIIKPITDTAHQQTEGTPFKIFVYDLPPGLNRDLVRCLLPHKTESCFRFV